MHRRVPKDRIGRARGLHPARRRFRNDAALAAALAVAACAEDGRSDGSPPQAPPAEARADAKQAAAPPRAEVSAPDLEAVLALSPDCVLGEPLASIFQQMTVIDPETFESRQGEAIRIAGLARPLQPTFRRTVTALDHGAEVEVVAELPLNGRWRGLRVAGFRLNYIEESDVSAREIRFDEPAGRVRQVLNRHGFALPATGQVRSVDPGDGVESLIGVDADGSGSSLQCATG